MRGRPQRGGKCPRTNLPRSRDWGARTVKSFHPASHRTFYLECLWGWHLGALSSHNLMPTTAALGEYKA